MVTDTTITDLRPQGFDPTRETVAILGLNIEDATSAYHDARIFEPELVADRNVRIVFPRSSNLSGLRVHAFYPTSRAAQHPGYAAAVNSLEIAVAMTNGDV